MKKFSEVVMDWTIIKKNPHFIRHNTDLICCHYVPEFFNELLKNKEIYLLCDTASEVLRSYYQRSFQSVIDNHLYKSSNIEILKNRGVPVENLTPYQSQLLTVCLELSNEKTPVILATDDPQLKSYATILDIRDMDSHAYSNLLFETAFVEARLLAVQPLARRRLLNVLAYLGTFVFIMAIGLLVIFLNVIQFIVSISFLLATLLFIALGFGAFWFRCQTRFIYGLIETGLGCLTGGYVFWTNNNPFIFNMDSAIKLVGGIYFIVRGLDNVGKGIDKKDRTHRNLFRRIFPDT